MLVSFVVFLGGDERSTSIGQRDATPAQQSRNARRAENFSGRELGDEPIGALRPRDQVIQQVAIEALLVQEVHERRRHQHRHDRQPEDAAEGERIAAPVRRADVAVVVTASDMKLPANRHMSDIIVRDPPCAPPAMPRPARKPFMNSSRVRAPGTSVHVRPMPRPVCESPPPSVCLPVAAARHIAVRFCDGSRVPLITSRPSTHGSTAARWAAVSGPLMPGSDVIERRVDALLLQIRHQLPHVAAQPLNLVVLRRRDVEHVEVHAEVDVRATRP